MNDSYSFDLICLAFQKQGITFSKTVAAKLVGGEYRLEKLVCEGKIQVDKPTAKQNGKWHCNGSDVLRFTKL